MHKVPLFSPSSQPNPASSLAYRALSISRKDSRVQTEPEEMAWQWEEETSRKDEPLGEIRRCKDAAGCTPGKMHGPAVQLGAVDGEASPWEVAAAILPSCIHSHQSYTYVQPCRWPDRGIGRGAKQLGHR